MPLQPPPWTALRNFTEAALSSERPQRDIAQQRRGDQPERQRIGPALAREVLRQHGYNTAMFGKHHNTPNGQLSAAGPFDHWPTGLGFEYFYGFLGGDTNQWHPRLFRGIQRVETPDTIGQDATLDKFLIDDAIDWLHNHLPVAPDKPFLMYAALGTNHSPHQVPAEWIAKFRGKFDMGWDKLREQTLARQIEQGAQADIFRPGPSTGPQSDDEEKDPIK